MPLFGNTPPINAHIVPCNTTALSKEQKSFNNLIKKIEVRRASLNEWEAMLPIFRQKYATDLLPLQEECTALECELAVALDAAHTLKGITKGEKRKLSVMIMTLAEQILMGKDDPEIKDLFNKHGLSDYDQDEASRLDDLKAMLESSLGMELGDDVDLTSPEEVFRHFEAQFQAKRESFAGNETTRRKSRREGAKAARKEAEEQQMSQSIRDIFRKLASALHPDRESDPVERDRKTALMQQANVAYDKSDLLKLLELQIELEQIDRDHLAAIQPERLKHYIKILKGQVADLDIEIEGLKYRFTMEFGLSPFTAIQPTHLLSILKSDMTTCQAQIRDIREQIDLTTDSKRLKAWLKTISHSVGRDSGFDL